ncbi:MAG: ferrochelatase [Caedibacter sp. 38-128]|nr:ferrochelatase [Holosporales bacterium]OJX08540.1 MAG: ferrochelatase [Caedibacter sp. 38-128]
MNRKAVILFNLGGPDGPEAIEPFLFNLFNDRAILPIFQPFRRVLAFLIARRRKKEAQAIYGKLGGGSPLLANTQQQASALEACLGKEWRVFIAMRYWHPLIDATVKAVKAYDPTEIILLPLYPQFSTTTTASSLKAWTAAVKKAALEIPTKTICCYPHQEGFIAANCDLIQQALKGEKRRYRLLFSAHGLPEKLVRQGDPYQQHIELSAQAIADQLGNPDFVVCYQSKVGPLKWLTPSTDAEIRRAGREEVGVVVVPISFVSEHSETLVELDMQYQALANTEKVPFYCRIPTVSTHTLFINGLGQMIKSHQEKLASGCFEFKCDPQFINCICRRPS